MILNINNIPTDGWILFSAENWIDYTTRPGGPCPSPNRLPQNFIDILLERIQPSPSGAWSEFNCKMAHYKSLFHFMQQGLLCKDDIPASGPQITDYTDLSTQILTVCSKDSPQYWLKQDLPN